MSPFKRLTATLTARLDQLVSDIENHEAVTEAYLRQLAKAIAEAKLRHQQLLTEQERLEIRAKAQRKEMNQWENRAIACAKTDESRALACIARAENLTESIALLDQQITQISAASEKLKGDVLASEQRLSEVKLKKSLLQARESAASTLKASATDTSIDTALENSFSRWEKDIMQTEILNTTESHLVNTEILLHSHNNRDELAQAFAAEEKQTALKTRLDALLAGGHTGQNKHTYTLRE